MSPGATAVTSTEQQPLEWRAPGEAARVARHRRFRAGRRLLGFVCGW